MGCQFANWLEELGSNSEVDRFRVQMGHRLFIERRDLVVAPHLVDQDRISPPVCRTHADKNTLLRPQSIEEVWPIGTRIDLNRQYLSFSPRHHLHGRN